MSIREAREGRQLSIREACEGRQLSTKKGLLLWTWPASRWVPPPLGQGHWFARELGPGDPESAFGQGSFGPDGPEGRQRCSIEVIQRCGHRGTHISPLSGG